MAAAAAPAASGLSKAEYLRRRYLEADGAESSKKRRRKRKAAKEAAAGRMRIVDDDDVSWKVMPAEQEKEEEEEGDEADLPVVAEFIDERPDEVKWMEAFRASNKWKLLGDQNEELQPLKLSVTTSSSETSKQNTKKPLLAQSSPRRGCHSSPDRSPPRQGCPDLSPERPPSAAGRHRIKSWSRGQREFLSSEHSASRKKTPPDVLLPRNKTSCDEGDLWQPQTLQPSRTNSQLQPTASSPRKRQRHDSESSSDSPPPRRNARATCDSDLSLPRASAQGGTQRPDSPLDLSPLRRNRHTSSNSDCSPPRRGPEGEEKGHKSRSPPTVSSRRQTLDITGVSQRMLSGGSAGLVSAESLRREKQDFKRQDGGRSSSKRLEGESSVSVSLAFASTAPAGLERSSSQAGPGQGSPLRPECTIPPGKPQ